MLPTEPPANPEEVKPSGQGNPLKQPRHRMRWKLLLALGIIWITVPAALGITLMANLGVASSWLQGRPSDGIVIFALMLACTTGLGLLPPYAQAILGGWVFGSLWGTVAVMCGLIGGATIGFSLARILSGETIVRIIDHYPKARIIRGALVDASQKRTFLLIFLLRLPPNSPFALGNLAMGASGVRAAPFLAGSVLGLLPRTIAVCFAAGSAAATGAKDIQDLAKQQGLIWLAVGVAGLVMALVTITVVARRALARAGFLG